MQLYHAVSLGFNSAAASQRAGVPASSTVDIEAMLPHVLLAVECEIEGRGDTRAKPFTRRRKGLLIFVVNHSPFATKSHSSCCRSLSKSDAR